jgi:hypothetical protein
MSHIVGLDSHLDVLQIQNQCWKAGDTTKSALHRVIKYFHFILLNTGMRQVKECSK